MDENLIEQVAAHFPDVALSTRVAYTSGLRALLREAPLEDGAAMQAAVEACAGTRRYHLRAAALAVAHHLDVLDAPEWEWCQRQKRKDRKDRKNPLGPLRGPFRDWLGSWSDRVASAPSQDASDRAATRAVSSVARCFDLAQSSGKPVPVVVMETMSDGRAVQLLSAWGRWERFRAERAGMGRDTYALLHALRDAGVSKAALPELRWSHLRDGRFPRKVQDAEIKLGVWVRPAGPVDPDLLQAHFDWAKPQVPTDPVFPCVPGHGESLTSETFRSMLYSYRQFLAWEAEQATTRDLEDKRRRGDAAAAELRHLLESGAIPRPDPVPLTKASDLYVPPPDPQDPQEAGLPEMSPQLQLALAIERGDVIAVSRHAARGTLGRPVFEALADIPEPDVSSLSEDEIKATVAELIR